MTTSTLKRSTANNIVTGNGCSNACSEQVLLAMHYGNEDQGCFLNNFSHNILLKKRSKLVQLCAHNTNRDRKFEHGLKFLKYHKLFSKKCIVTKPAYICKTIWRLCEVCTEPAWVQPKPFICESRPVPRREVHFTLYIGWLVMNRIR